jgi:hypothetical protein
MRAGSAHVLNLDDRQDEPHVTWYGRHSGSEFTPTVLASRKMHGGSSCTRGWPSFVDHPYFYRQDRRAVVLVAHDYNMPVTLPKVQA